MFKTPNIRFKDFNKSWQENTIEQVVMTITGGGTPSTNNKSYWIGKIPWIQSSDLKENEFFDVKIKNYISEEAIKNSATKVIKENSLAIVTRVGVGKLAYLPFKYCTSQDFISLSDLLIDPYFLLYLISNKINSILILLQGTSIKGITKESFLSTSINYPKAIEEQQKIGNFISQIDNFILLLSKKIDLLKKYKELMLSKMFPKDGCDVPDVRFKGFSEKWKKDKFSNFIERRSEIDNNKFLPHIEYEDIISGEGCLNKDIFSKHSSKSGIKFVKNDILFGKLRPYLKNYLIADFSGIAVGDFWVLFSRNCSTKFIYYLIQTSIFQSISNQSIGTKMPRSDWKLVSNYEFYIPKDVDEQIKIELYLEKIDSIYLKFTNKLKIVKKIKYTLLSKMFI